MNNFWDSLLNKLFLCHSERSEESRLKHLRCFVALTRSVLFEQHDSTFFVILNEVSA